MIEDEIRGLFIRARQMLVQMYEITASGTGRRRADILRLIMDICDVLNDYPQEIGNLAGSSSRQAPGE